MTPQAKPGIAYCVFKCSDPRPAPALTSRFKEALENVKLAHEETKIPQEIDFFAIELYPVIATLRANGGEAELVGMAEALQRKGANYLIQASLPGSSNETVARDLGDAMNMLYGGTELFDAENEGRSPLLMEIFFKDDAGRYVSKMELDGMHGINKPEQYN